MSFLLKLVLFICIAAILSVFIYVGFFPDSAIQQTVIKTVR